MDVVAHQHIGVNPAMLLVRVMTQQAKVGDVVAIGEEHGLAVVAALDDMLRISGCIDPSWPRHGLLLVTGGQSPSLRKGSDPEHLPIPRPCQSVHGLPLGQ